MSYVKYRLPVLNNRHKNNLKRIKRDTELEINQNRKNQITLAILNKTSTDRYIDKKINESKWNALKLKKKNNSKFKQTGSFFIKRKLKKSINIGFSRKSIKNLKFENLGKKFSVKKIHLNFEFQKNIEKKIEGLKKNRLFDNFIFKNQQFGFQKKFVNQDFRCWKKVRIR